MLVVYYCPVDMSDYIVLSRRKVHVFDRYLFGGRLNFWHNFWRWGQSGRDCS